ncbi:MAG TPA: hypothetical protein VFX16_22520 [Pseudonocardiaceae bacterium]|nr:hypothetical protein [Pseudonocardiaceae bacterium]
MVDPEHDPSQSAPQIAWYWRGGPEHAEQMNRSERILARLPQVNQGLDLIAYVIDLSAASMNDGTQTSNELAAVSCYTRAFRALRAATILALEGLYLEARVYIRDVYESAGLARMLAKEPRKADDWLQRERWVKDNEVRQYAEKFTAPGEDPKNSPYREYYRIASELHHPTARACIPLVLAGPNERCRPRLASEYDENELDEVLREIAMEAVFVCFTMINAAVDQSVIYPPWRKAVVDLAEVLSADLDWSHLDRDWTADQESFDELRAHVIGADAIKQELDQNPNSFQNVQKRRDQSSS